ncbi:MAG: shikimate kinase [Methyloligellaceae bacterium]
MHFGFRRYKRKGGSQKIDKPRKIKEALEGRSVVLVGLMGAGKSALGKRLATLLDLTFADADDEIEAAAGKTISDIFAEHGEAYFRDGEQRVIMRLLQGGPQILATGGGAFMNEITRKNIKEAGVSIWLKADLDVLMDRVGRRTHRPLLQTDNPRAVMQKLMDERYPVYQAADITIHSRDVTHEVILDEIIVALYKHLVQKG